jgi:CheY-like chemotaxis protein
MSIVLVVDDRLQSRYIMGRALERAGYDVREAATGQQAIVLARIPPDVIILDVRLPDMDGFEVCRRLKLDPTTAMIPVVHKTAALDPLGRERSLASGAAAYLIEPLFAEELLATVRTLLATAA